MLRAFIVAVVVTHATAAVGVNDPTKQVSKNAWNADHTIVGLGSAASAATSDFDAAGVAAAAIVTHVALPDPHAQYALESSLAAVATSGLKADVGLGNVDNTSDASKPVSMAQQTALDLKANLAGPTFTGTVSGITATMVGLGNVTNNAQTQAAIVPNTAPAAGRILVGNAGGTAYAPVAMGTDATLSSAGALTIANAAVTLAKMENRATQTFIGRNTAATGVPEELSIATAKTMLALTGTNSGDQTITLTGNVTGTGTGSFVTTIASGVVTRTMLEATGKNWQFLGTATASGAVRTGTITWTGTFKQLLFEYFIAGYSGGAIGRLIVGPTAGLSETGTTFCTNLIEGVTQNTTSVSVPGWPLAVTATAVPRFGWMHVSNVASVVKRMTGVGNHSGTAATVVPIAMKMDGLFSDATNLINKAELAVYAAITGTAISATTFNAGTYLNVYGRNDD